MKKLMVFVLLAACGADGAPVTPRTTTNLGVSIDGNGTISPRAGISTTNGPLTMSLDL